MPSTRAVQVDFGECLREWFEHHGHSDQCLYRRASKMSDKECICGLDTVLAAIEALQRTIIEED